MNAVQTFPFTLNVAPDAARKLPRAVAQFTASVERTTTGHYTPAIELAYLRFPDRSESVVRSQNFDELLTLDFGKGDRLIGIELLGVPSTKRLVEFMTFVREPTSHPDALLFLLGPATLVEAWPIASAAVSAAVSTLERATFVLEAEGLESVRGSIEKLSVKLLEELEAPAPAPWAPEASSFARGLVAA